MDFGSRFDKSLLRSRETATNAFDWVESEYRPAVLIHRVEMWAVMRSADFDEHPDDDSEEPRNLWHVCPQFVRVSETG